MYIVNEENHSGIAIVEDPRKAIDWLLKNNWLSYNSCGVLANDTDIELWQFIEVPEIVAKIQPEFISKYFKTLNLTQFLETMEIFGFYFQEVDIID